MGGIETYTGQKTDTPKAGTKTKKQIKKDDVFGIPTHLPVRWPINNKETLHMTDLTEQQQDMPAETNSITAKHSDLQDRIETGLTKIEENETIAEFFFKKGNKPKGLKFIFAGVEESKSGKNRKSPKIGIQTVGNPKTTITWTAKWALSSGNDTINCQLKELTGFWTLFKRDATNEEEDGSGYKMQSELPGFRPLVDEHFISFWFPGDDSNADTEGKATEITKQPAATPSKEFKQYFWDKLKVNDSKFTVEPVVDDPLKEDEDTDKKLAYFITGLLCWRFFMVCCSGSSAESEIEKSPAKDKMKQLLPGSIGENGSNIIEQIYQNLPALKEYRPKRPVDINPQKVYEEILKQLKLPWHVVASATAALNAGKHIIFTGPPGCGKTHVAAIIARYVSKKPPLMSTASQAWSADEIIGRYMPASDGQKLVFKRGFFLRALDTERWLIIDEINRCDIDNCFGELFTVLSGQSVTLPFEDVPETGSETSDGTDSNKPLPVRIVVGSDESADFEDINYTPVRFSEKFRLLATMNDADVAGLNQLSYALRRRFAIIRIDAPDDVIKKEIFENHINQVSNDLDLDNLIYMLHRETKNTVTFKNHIKDIICKLFAHAKEKDEDHEDLIDLRIVGVAPVLDIIRFVGEGMRAPTSDERIQGTGGSQQKEKKALMDSFLAMGLVLSVFPQLDAAISEPEERFEPALQCIFGAFDANQPFFHIIKEEGENDQKSKKEGENVLKLKQEGTIHEFLRRELKRQFANDHAVKDLVDKYQGLNCTKQSSGAV